MSHSKVQPSANSTSYLCSDIAEIEWKPGAVSLRTIANLESIHHHGAELSCDVPIPRRAQAKLVLGDRTFRCRSTGCVRDEAFGYLVTVKFVSASLWSPNRFTPRHLLDLDAPETQFPYSERVSKDPAPRAFTADRLFWE